LYGGLLHDPEELSVCSQFFNVVVGSPRESNHNAEQLANK